MIARLVLTLVLAAVPLLGQDVQDKPKSDKSDTPDSARKMRRLESVTWNPVAKKLIWSVSNGSTDGTGNYQVGNNKLTYEIDLSEVTMQHNGSKRRFSKEEAANVLVVMGLISKYAQDSVVWWEQGHGEPVDKKERVQLERDLAILARLLVASASPDAR